MSFSVAIVGLPNSGKSTLFKALTKKKVGIAPYPFTTISPNIGEVAVFDKRLEAIAKIIKPEKITPAVIEFVDIAGLVKKAHQGEGLGNQFLAQIRECKIILEVVREFKSDQIEHVEKTVDSKRDMEIIRTELILKDWETIENALKNLEGKAKSGQKEAIQKFNLLKTLKDRLNEGKKISELNLNKEEILLIKEFQFLTEKPVVYLLNIDRETDLKTIPIKMNLKMEEEISELNENELKELEVKNSLDYLVQTCYDVLNLITFYTVVGSKEVRAWSLKKGSEAVIAASKVHSDFKEKFIKAEVINWEKLINAGSWPEARESGVLKTVGKEYLVQDGDVIEFKI